MAWWVQPKIVSIQVVYFLSGLAKRRSDRSSKIQGDWQAKPFRLIFLLQGEGNSSWMNFASRILVVSHDSKIQGVDTERHLLAPFFLLAMYFE